LCGQKNKQRKNSLLNRRSIYNRYVDPTGGRQTQEDSNRQLMLLPPPAPPTPPPPLPPPPVLQTTQSNNTNSSNNKLEESGGAKHIDPKLIEMITSEVIGIFISKDVEESVSCILESCNLTRPADGYGLNTVGSGRMRV